MTRLYVGKKSLNGTVAVLDPAAPPRLRPSTPVNGNTRIGSIGGR
jgi:hypothetical protein